MLNYNLGIDNKFLKEEFFRLSFKFSPTFYQHLPSVDIRVVDSHPENWAAKCILDKGVVEFYKNYHDKYPEEYKVTLLHELGHFFLGEDHRYFKSYYDYIAYRQNFIPEKVVPNSYNQFLYSKSLTSNVSTFKCSGCLRSVEETSFERAYCSGCDKQMLLVSGL
tara:strand:- start:1182 stop:1673 length:492 start_codon:yes stop_codon:yes gene_type:complete